MRRKQKNNRTNLAVTEILGCIIMLSIATTSFSSVYYYISSAPAPIPTPIVEMSGMMDNNQVIVTHCGGEPLDLDTELVLNIGGNNKSFKVGDYLDSEAKEDGFWGLSEKFVYPLDYGFDFIAYPNIDINVVDRVSNSLLLTGLTKVNPTCDIGVEIAVDNLYPKVGELIEFTITATNEGNINASGILINYLLPEGLNYYSSTMDMGTYNSWAGIWDISQLPMGESAELKISAIVGEEFFNSNPTQLAVILDGSETIEPVNWSIMKNGLFETVKNSMPHNGAVELTVIQFGGLKPAFARLEIGPIVITESNVDSVLDKIQDLDQIGDRTPTAAGILMAADVLKASDRFDPDMRQVVLLVTDGNPTHCADCDGDYLDDKCNKVNGPKDSAVVARDYLVDLLELNENDDEFNVLSIELEGDGHTYYLRDDIVWPQPCINISDITDDTINGGWLSSVSSWQDFTASIDESFKTIFNVLISVNIKTTGFYDPRESNDMNSIILKPTLEKAEIIDDDQIAYI